MKGLWLLIALLWSVVGTSGIDVLFYHMHAADTAVQHPHYESAGTGCSHADRCVLGSTLPGPRLLPLLPLVGRMAAVPGSRPLSHSTEFVPSFDPTSIQQSRAPPGALS